MNVYHFLYSGNLTHKLLPSVTSKNLIVILKHEEVLTNKTDKLIKLFSDLISGFIEENFNGNFKFIGVVNPKYHEVDMMLRVKFMEKENSIRVVPVGVRS